MAEPEPTTKDRRVSLPPKTDREAIQKTKDIVQLIDNIKPDATPQELYAGVRDEALVNCSRLLSLPENWALTGQTETETYKFKFSPKNGEPLDTPEARLAFMECRISDELGEKEGSSLELLRHLSQEPKTNRVTLEAAKAVDLKALKCEQCGSNDFHFDPKLFEQLTPAGGEKPLFRQMVVVPGEQVAVIQGFDASAMFNPSAPIVLKCGHCETGHTLGDPISGASFLSEFRRYYETKGYTVVVQAKKQ